MQCPACKFDNADGMNFCGKCGYKLSPSLKSAREGLSYDEKLKKIQKYLPKGLTEKILSQRDKIEGERKHVTVMFCDMVGFTQLSEAIGPEQAYSVMDQIYEILIHIVHDHEGTVNEFTGDGIMALFGAPIALEDAPQRAMRSACAIHREMAHLSKKIKGEKIDIPSLKMRIGIHTGPVVVGSLGNDLRVEFKAVGDTVNLASRMESLAEPSTTYVTKDAFRLTEGLFQFEALGEKEIKGKKKPVPAYKLLSVKEEAYRPRLGFERMIYSEMVGRDKELDRLQLSVMKAINGEGSVVNVIGEAGIGKSRLIAELKGCDVIKKVTLLEGRAISIGKKLSFHLIINLLKAWAQIREDDSGAAALSKLETSIRQVHPEGVEEVLPFVATLMTMKLSGSYAERVKGIEGEALEKLIVKNIKDLLIKATKLSPLVLVAEDLHWADASSIDLMESIFPLAHTQRILFLNVFRPGYKSTTDKLLEGIRKKHSDYYLEIVLEPLDEKMSEILINNILKIKGLQHKVVDQIVERADGNPFFIEEVVRSLFDEGAVVSKNGAFEVSEKINEMLIPYTINDVLMARIDRLDEETRNLVKVASVIGRSFFYRILTDVAETVENIDNRLSFLKEIQLIRERRRMEEIEYLFKHALAQEAAYESILELKRKEIHLKVADSIEKMFKERLHEFFGMLAYHYSKGNNLDKAEEYMIRAGEEALKSSASNEALLHYKEALKLYLQKVGKNIDTQKVAILEKNIAFALYNKGHYVDAIGYFNNVLLYFGIKTRRGIVSTILMFLRSLFELFISIYIPSIKWKQNPSKEDKEIIKLFEKKINALGQTNIKSMFIESFYNFKRLSDFELNKIEGGIGLVAGMAGILSFSGLSFRLSRKILEFCSKKMERNDVKSLLYYELCSLIHIYFAGNWGKLKEFDNKLVDTALSVGEIKIIIDYIIYHGLIQIERGSFEYVQGMVDKLAEIATKFDNQLAQLFKYELNAKLFTKFGRYQDAQKELREGILLAQKMGLENYLIYFYTLRSQIQIMLNDIIKAELSLKNAKQYVLEKDLPPTFIAHFLIGEFCFFIHQMEESAKGKDIAVLSRNRKTAKKLGKKIVKISKKVAVYRTEAFRLMGVYYWLINNQKNALYWFDRSMSEGHKNGTLVELSRTYLEIGKRLKDPKSKFSEFKGLNAESFLKRARTIFENIDLQWDLNVIDKINANS